ncbi:hypothetical protein E2F46_01910 [Luteimonas aestuarii]|uniref:Uncharacterized protein n=1 Tax=Luteimonas aestuarii TaxID=453837 RepID=A0A4R5U4I9_9GAMM|nr:hypothetical protein [Luteimonas aestuarii]TDK28647.1 hypothetical protein E2F46_01910 [Luteimonas aestuarii]
MIPLTTQEQWEMSAIKPIVMVVLSSMLVVACGDRAKPAGGVGAATEAPDPFAFAVEVTLSGVARQQLDASAETVVVAASYFGGAREGVAASELNDVGLIDLGRVEVEHAGEGSVLVDGGAVRRYRLGLVEGEPQVNVNVYSGRRTSPDNILACDMFQDGVRVAVAAPVRIACRLLSEADADDATL